MDKPRVLQDFSRVDFSNMDESQRELYSEIKSAKAAGELPAITVRSLQALEMALELEVDLICYSSSEAQLETGERVYYWITPEHAIALARVLNGREPFHFDLTLSTWEPGAFEAFVNEIKKGSSRVERFFLCHHTGDEFKVSHASCLAELVDLWQCKALRIKNNEYEPGSLEELARRLNELGNRFLGEILVFPFSDDPRGGGPLQIPGVGSIVAKNSSRHPMDETEFANLMTLISSDFNSREYDQCAGLSDALLKSYDLDPHQAGWFVDYRHRAWYFTGDLKNFERALAFMERPGIHFNVSKKNGLWMLSTASEMAYRLGNAEQVRRFIDQYLQLNAATPEDFESLQNEIRCRLNAYLFWTGLGDTIEAKFHRTRVIQSLREDPDRAEGIDLPIEIRNEFLRTG